MGEWIGRSSVVVVGRGGGKLDDTPKKRKIANGSDLCSFSVFTLPGGGCAAPVFCDLPFAIRALFLFSLPLVAAVPLASHALHLFRSVLSFASNCVVMAEPLRSSGHDVKSINQVHRHPNSIMHNTRGVQHLNSQALSVSPNVTRILSFCLLSSVVPSTQRTQGPLAILACVGGRSSAFDANAPADFAH